MELIENKSKSTTRIFGLDVIRTIAILLVIGSHLYYVLGNGNPTVIALSGLAGYAGVELFFVLSGFLIGNILLQQFLMPTGFSYANLKIFIKRRWFRTLPNYYLVLFLHIMMAYGFGYLPDNWWRYTIFLQNAYSYEITFFSESWSLSVEEWTYVIVPLVLCIGGYFSFFKSQKWKFFSLLLMLVCIAHTIRYFTFLQQRYYTLEVWNTHWKSVALYRFDAILFGVLLAWGITFYKDFFQKNKVYLLIIAAHLFVLQFFILNVLQVDIISNPIFYHVFYGSLTSLIFVGVLPCFLFWEKANGAIAKLVLGISKISYAAYLLHYGIVAVLLKYSLGYFAISLSFWVLGVLYLGITFFLSFLLYRYYELPMTNLRDKS